MELSFCFFPELWIFSSLHPQCSSDGLQADGHSHPAASDCNQEVHTQTSGSWRRLIHPSFLRQPGGQASKPHDSPASPGFLRHGLHSEPAHFQCSGEVGPAGAPAAPSPGGLPVWPAACPQPRTGAVHACPAEGS